MFGGYLKQSTAVTIAFGPFVDAADGFTPETALTISQADYRISKNGAAFAQKNEATSGVHMEFGWYTTLLDATDTATLGRLVLAAYESGARHVTREYHVLAANIYDSLFGAATDKLQVDVAEWLSTAAATPTTAGVPEVDVTFLNGVAQSLQDLKDFADDGYDPATNKLTGLLTVDELGTAAKASVNAEVLDVLNVDTFAAPGQGAPASTTTMRLMIAYIYKWLRNRRTLNKDTGVESFYNDDAATVDHKRTAADDGTTASVTEIATGP